jgi:hypothetical protein
MIGNVAFPFYRSLLRRSSSVRAHHQVLVDKDTQRPAWPDRDGRLDIEVPLDQALSRAVGRGLRRLLQRLDEVAFRIPEGELAADAEDGREGDALEELPGVEVDLVGEACRRCRWRAGCR